MQALLVLPFLLLLSSLKASAYIGVGGGVGVWINGRGVTTQSPPSSATNTPSRDYTALQAWKAAITEDPTGVLASWVGPDVCSYRGVFCSDPPGGDLFSTTSSSNVVVAIDLNHASLKGTLVKELALLTHLSILHLNSNRLSGTVPDSFGDFQYLTELDLSNNLLSGPFPTPTLLIPNLIYLDLRFNGFSGGIPDELFQKDLDAIFLNNNQFEGQIPMSLWGSPASVITLANNKFSGSLPASFGYMASRIREVLFLNNELTGCIPDGLGYLTDIEVLDLSFNSLAGHVPGSLSCLSGIEVFNIAHNQFSGVLPDFCDLRSLANLTVSDNFFSGFSQECARSFLKNVLGFDFSGNCIPGRDMQRSLPECTDVPGDGLSCLRIPTARPLACSVPMVEGAVGLPGVIPYTLAGSLP